MKQIEDETILNDQVGRNIPINERIDNQPEDNSDIGDSIDSGEERMDDPDDDDDDGSECSANNEENNNPQTSKSANLNNTRSETKKSSIKISLIRNNLQNKLNAKEKSHSKKKQTVN